MKKLIVTTLLIALCCVFVIPQEAGADGPVEGAIIGAAIGAVVGLTLWVISKKENPQEVERVNIRESLSKNYTTTDCDELPAYLKKAEQQAVSLYSLKIEF